LSYADNLDSTYNDHSISLVNSKSEYSDAVDDSNCDSDDGMWDDPDSDHGNCDSDIDHGNSDSDNGMWDDHGDCNSDDGMLDDHSNSDVHGNSDHGSSNDANSDSESDQGSSDQGQCDEDIEIDEKMFEPIYDGASITVCGAYCAIMEFKRACRLPFTAIAMLLQLLQLLCPPANKLPRSVYVLKKFFQRYSSPHTTQRYCPECRTELERKQCTNAGCQGKETDYLITLTPDRSIQTIVASM